MGPTKGAILDAKIRECKPLVMVELGAGCSAVRFAALLCEVAGPESHFFSFAFAPECTDVVEEMVAFAGVRDHVTLFTGAFADQIDVIRNKSVDVSVQV